jgi:hypothetical protein
MYWQIKPFEITDWDKMRTRLQEHSPNQLSPKFLQGSLTTKLHYKKCINRVFVLAINELGAVREFGYENILSANGPKPWFRSFWK